MANENTNRVPITDAEKEQRKMEDDQACGLIEEIKSLMLKNPGVRIAMAEQWFGVADGQSGVRELHFTAPGETATIRYANIKGQLGQSIEIDGNIPGLGASGIRISTSRKSKDELPDYSKFSPEIEITYVQKLAPNADWDPDPIIHKGIPAIFNVRNAAIRILNGFTIIR